MNNFYYRYITSEQIRRLTLFLIGEASHLNHTTSEQRHFYTNTYKTLCQSFLSTNSYQFFPHRTCQKRKVYHIPLDGYNHPVFQIVQGSPARPSCQQKKWWKFDWHPVSSRPFGERQSFAPSSGRCRWRQCTCLCWRYGTTAPRSPWWCGEGW